MRIATGALAALLLFATAAIAQIGGPIMGGGSSFITSSGTFTGQIKAPDGAVGAPSYSFASNPTSGIYLSTANVVTIATAGAQAAAFFGTSGFIQTTGAYLAWGANTTPAGGAGDLYLFRDAANAFAQRNGTNAQISRVYNTFTDASNYERVDIGWNPGGVGANIGGMVLANLGTGNARQMYLGTGGAAAIHFLTSGTDRWQFTSTGMLVATTDNSLDIGASGANRPRNLYLSSSVKQVGGVTTSSTTGVAAVVANGRSVAQSGAVGSVSTFTVGASDGSFEVSANVLVTTATTHAFTVTCAYTDEGNTARTVTMTFGLVAGGVTTTSIANANGAVPYMGVPLHIRAKGATTITIATTGTFTTVTYNVEGIIKQTN